MPTTLRNTDILFNDGTTQSTAASGVPTTYGAVGTYVTAYVSMADNTTAVEGTTTYAASSLVRAVDAADGYATALNVRAVLGGGLGYLAGAPAAFNVGTASLSLSGTWRLMTRMRNVNGETSLITGLFLRIS